MALPDLTTLTDPDEIAAWMTAAAVRMQELRESAEQTEADRRAAITQAKTALRTLLGPKGAPAGTGSIRAVAAYDDATIAQHQRIFNRLVLQCLEALADTQLDVAEVVGD